MGERAADARPDDPLDGDRHPPSDRRARLEADQGAGDRDLAAPRRGLALHRGDQVHPRGHPDGALEGEPGPGDAGEVPRPARPARRPADRARVRRRRGPLRRALGAPAGRARDPDGDRGRALHHRARHRGPADRDAARGPRGRRDGRARGAGSRLRRRRLRAGDRARRSPSSPRSSTRSCSTTGAWPSCSATTARPTRSTSRSSRAATARSRAFRGCRGSWRRRSSTTSATWRPCSPPRTPTSRRSRGWARPGAKEIREGIRRLQEVDIVDRYL